MILTLPFPPSVNTYWRSPNSGPLKGRHLISVKGRDYRTNALACVLEQLKRRPKPITENVFTTIVFYPPDRRRRDMDNFLKAPLDALTHAGVWKDDSQVRRMLLDWAEPEKGGRIEIRIEVLNAG
ncbi:RusA family crossover junction endodeoxyribonuclease [Serratia proteamaculans]|uniref:RusA family crossover junction endodeoxyribonuclease n=1 Tax=Serratia proteamaculans TaxID=28151 RepID=UPI0039B124E4